jgi:hypothetical protein
MKTWQDGINDYYKLKRDYESSIDKDVKKLDKNMSINEKRREFKKLKPKCIDCNRPVGTIFSSKFDKEKDGRILSAVCGDIVDPCNLNISILCGYTETYPEIIEGLENDIKKLKNDIIVDKNKLLFGYITSDDILENFEKYKVLIGEKTERLTSVLELYTIEVDNKEVNDTINKLQEEIYLTIGYIKDAIKSYDNTNNTEFVNDSVNIFVSQLTPKLNQLMKLKYNYNTVEVDNGVWSLVQKKTSIEQLEFTYSDSVVNSFEYKTVNYSQKNKAKTAKIREDKSSKNKTVKNKKALIIEDSSSYDANSPDYAPNSPDYAPSESAKFTIETDGSIVWSDPDYNNLWNNLSKKLKLALIENPIWMETSMDSYVKTKKEKKPMVFVEPPNLIIPPNVLADDESDFGNELYNDLYNNPENSAYKTLNPSMLRNTMNDVIAKQLDFKKYV